MILMDEIQFCMATQDSKIINSCIDVRETDLNTDIDLKIDINFLKKKCYELGIKLLDNIIFIDQDTLIWDYVSKHCPNYIIIYSKLNKRHDKYDYYHVVTIPNYNDVEVMKKLQSFINIKFEKLKVFL